MIEHIYDNFAFFYLDILSFIIEFILNNKVVFYFFFVPVVTTCILLILDFVFDIRDTFTYFHKFRDDFYVKYKYQYNKNKKNKELNMEEVYKRSKEHAAYKHNLKMEEMRTFRENEEIRHNHKKEENEIYSKRYSVPKHKTNKKKVNLDIDYDEDE